MVLSIATKLLHSTVRISTVDAVGNLSSGTGFFYRFGCGDKAITTIVTNKHVIQNQARGFFQITMDDGKGEFETGWHEEIELLNFASHWIEHPDPAVDLALCLIDPLCNELVERGKRPFFVCLEKSIIPNGDQLSELDSVEEIMMIGYPNGLWDAVNNLPLIRYGITSSPPSVPYNGRPEFVIDAACFPGSSGSPVLLVNQGVWHDKRGNILHGSRVMFLGVLYAGPLTTVTGQIVIKSVPTAQQPIPIINMMMNLGFCVRAEKIHDFEAMLIQNGLVRAA